MIKVMIVDDELVVRDGIKYILEKSFPNDLEIVGMAKSGREAINIFEEESPQIVLMDIQMPGINGIEAIRAIQSINPNVKFIIISAYEHFDYAKSAFELGVEDYLTKPVSVSKVESVIKKVLERINKERSIKIKEIETQEKLDKILPILEHGYVYSVLMNDEYQNENNHYYELLGIEKEYATVFIIEFGEGESPGELNNKIGTGIKSNVQYDKIRQLIKFKSKAIVGPLMVNRLVAIVFDDQVQNEYAQRVKTIEMAERIHESLQKLTEAKVYIGIGGCYHRHRINISYNEALRAISKMTGENVLHISDVSLKRLEGKYYDFAKMKIDQETMLRRMEEGNTEKVIEILKGIFVKLESDYVNDIESIKSIVMEYVVMIHATAYRYDSSNEIAPFSQCIEEVNLLKNFFEFRDYLLNMAEQVTEHIRLEKETKVSNVISEAMKYVEANYNKELRLKDVAEVVSISPQYFSKIFKDELGYNFIDYLTHVRINKAKELLKNEKLSVKEVCYKIGYNDPNYFSRLFKKVEGKTPTEYLE